MTVQARDLAIAPTDTKTRILATAFRLFHEQGYHATGIATILREVKRLHRLPTVTEQRVLAERWAPWRSVAARILWSQYLAQRTRDSR